MMKSWFFISGEKNFIPNEKQIIIYSDQKKENNNPNFIINV